MQLPEISETTGSNVVRLPHSARKTRVLYAGDMEFAKAQFASVAPQLQLIPAATVLSAGADAASAPADPPDVALIDCGAPGVDARAIVDAIRASRLDLPIVLALDPGSGSEPAPTKVTAELRVDDYTVKLPGWLARLTSRLEFAIAHHRRRRSLETLQVSAERLRAVVETAPVCLARVARDGTILAMNAAAMKMVNAESSEEVLGKSLLTFVSPGETDDIRKFLDTVSGGQAGSLEFQTADSAGAARVVDARAVPLAADAEGRASALLVLRDATERKRLEESLADASPLAAAAPAPSSLLEEREALGRELDAARDSCRQLENERDALRAELDEARARASMVEHVRAACMAAEQQLIELKTDHQRTVEERDALARELDQARAHTSARAEREAERETQLDQIRSLDAERAHLASRCSALEALVASLEAERNAEREEHRVAREQANAAMRQLEGGSFAAERDALLASLHTLRAQFDEMSAALDATEARHAAEVHEQQAITASVEARLRDAEEKHRRIASERDELRAALESAERRRGDLQSALEDAESRRAAQVAEAEVVRRSLESRVEELESRVRELSADRDAAREELRASGAADDHSRHLYAALEEVRAARELQAAESEAVRRELTERIEELQTRVHAVLAERDAIRDEMRLALEAADERAAQLQLTVDDLRARRDAQALEAESTRRTLADRIAELQTRLDAVLVERESLERQLADTRAEHARRLEDATAERAMLQTRIAERESEYSLLAAQHAALQARLDRDHEASRMAARTEATPAPAATRPDSAIAMQDAQAAFREAVHLLSGELQQAVETTRAQHAALLRSHPTPYAALEERLRQAEADCRRLVVERDERETTVRALQAEIEQLIDVRRGQRKELVRALKEAEDAERRSAARLEENARLRQMLAEAQSILHRLSKWAATQSTRLGPAPVAGRTFSRLEGSGPRSAPEAGAGSPLEASWS